MKNLNHVARVLKQLRRDNPRSYPAELGDGTGVVAVPDRPGWVYVTMSGAVFQAYNSAGIGSNSGQPVMVGYDDISPDILRVLSDRPILTVGANEVSNTVGTHAANHEWGVSGGGTDLVFLEKKQFMPLRVFATSGMNVMIRPDIQYLGGAWRATEGYSEIDLTDYIPTASCAAMWVLVSAGSAGQTVLTSGSTKTLSTLAISDIPTPPTGEIPLAAIRLYEGQTRVAEPQFTAGNDIIDLRFQGVTPISGCAAFDYIHFNTSACAPTYAEGNVYWDNEDHTLAVQTEIAGTTLQVGQEMLVRVVNKSGSTLTDGTVVYINGAQGNRPTVLPAAATTELTARVLGVVTTDITNNAEGYVTTEGLVRGYNTSGFTAGDMLYLSAGSPGVLTNVQADAPYHAALVAVALNSTNNGKIYVMPDAGEDLHSLHDVSIAQPPANGDSLIYNTSASAWKNVSTSGSFLLLDTTNGEGYLVNSDRREPTGFVDRTTSSIAFTDATRTFSITPTSGSFYSYYHGKRHTHTSGSIQIAATTGLQFVYYASGSVLTNSAGHPGFDQDLIGTIYWNNSTGSGLLGDERHGICMDNMTHEYLHETIGTRYASGLAGTFSGSSSFTVGAGEYYDEDIEYLPEQQTTCRILYKNGSADWVWTTTPQTLPLLLNGTNIRYNNGTTLADVTNNYFVAYWIYATNNPDLPIVALIGQRQDTTIANARANNTPESLSLGTLPSAEMKLIYRVIYRNTGVAATRYQETADYRTVSTLANQNYLATAHSSLSGLTNPDHPASAIFTSTTSFNRILSATDTLVQTALDTLDDHVHASATTGCAGFLPILNGSGSTVLTGLGTWQARREVLTAARTYYVATTGNDNNDGLTAGTPFLTVQRGLNVASSLDLLVYDCTIQLADGTYTTTVGNILRSAVGSGKIIIQGNSATPENVIITSSNTVIPISAIYQRQTFTIKDLKLTTTGSATYAINVQGAGTIVEYSNVIFSTGFVTGHIRSLNDAYINATGGYYIQAGSGYHFVATKGTIDVNSRTITISGSPTFSGAFAFFSDEAYITAQSATWSGSAMVTAKKFTGFSNGVLNSSGSTTLPGATLGTVATGAQAV